MLADTQTDRQTDCNTPLPYRSGEIIKMSTAVNTNTNSETQLVNGFIALLYYCIQIVMLSVELDVSKSRAMA